MWIDTRYFEAKWTMRFYFGNLVYRTYTWYECEATGETMFIWRHAAQFDLR